MEVLTQTIFQKLKNPKLFLMSHEIKILSNIQSIVVNKREYFVQLQQQLHYSPPAHEHVLNIHMCIRIMNPPLCDTCCVSLF